ncbi:hypothetical protein C6345_18410 [Bacillus sp. LNXM12-2]|uniref:hypothetical protein n=1 Tax=unclassified Bacillus (in: firmicutes) TaxID=185979 RepID=UPI000750FE17|nr:hypothetical protein [Bacillus sp. AM 13(2015)]KUR61201.1 hypothetical protein AOQ70_15890 [Bacillus sp. AM 13(2015)]PSB71930.1 hypothetical protein C6Y07_06235 [Bacillus sp. LNXM12-1]PSB72251.1 hypothetical protein C6345_18410 [Bacillus sp. LNXM12-2]
MNTQKITIPDRDSNGCLIGFRELNVLWECPTCGCEMCEPQLTQHAEDGFYGSVHTWESKCGHVAKYADLKEISG